MKIDDFEYYVDSKILERGRELFEKGCVCHTDSYGANWYFSVKGTKLYRTVVCLHKNGNINFESCSCPYAERYLCKHVIACLFYIRKELGIKRETMLSKFIKKNPELVEQKDYKKITKKFMQSVFNRIRHSGYIEYDDMSEFAIAIDELLEYFKADNEILSNKQLLLELCLFLINTISKTKYNCDDSNGEITASFYTVTEFIEQNILEQNNALFSISFEYLTNPKNEYDFELDKLPEITCQFAQTDIDKQKIKKYLKNLIETSDYPKRYIEVFERFFKG